MESNRAVVSLESHKIEHRSVLKLVTTSSCGSNQHRVRRRCLAVITGVTLQWLSIIYGAAPAWGQTQQAAVEPKRPTLQIGNGVRFDEDWSVLRGVDRSKTDDFWDLVKFIPLNQDQTVWLSLGGQVRQRLEYFDQFQFGMSAPRRSDVFLASRLRWNADLHATPYFRLFAEGKSSLVPTNRDLQGGNSNTFMDTIALQNGFADIVLPLSDQANVTLRGGRQELTFGHQRLVGVSDYTNVRRTFDGARSIVRAGDWTINPFWAQHVVVRQYQPNTSTDDEQLFGIYSTAPAHLLPMNLDLYYLGVDNKTAAFNGTSGREKRYTLGLRMWGKIGETGFDFETEGAGQFGKVGGSDVGAGMFTAVLGYTLPVKEWSPRVYFEFDYASGDKKPGGNVSTFNQLYPSAHGFLGYIDYVGRQNIISPNAGVEVTPVRDLKLSLQQYFFWRASDRDALYNTGGAVTRPGTTTRALYIGAETDLLANYQFTYHLLGYMGYSYFFPGGFIHKTGRHKASNYVYAALEYTF
jgi:Alginate export